MAELINSIVDGNKFQLNNIHLIGHSLGAHICGYVGDRVKGLGRISGLDPAGPYFEHTDPTVRLDTTDAEYVDVYHTNSGPFGTGFGLLPAIGHVDYYVNGGYSQPGKLINNFKLTNIFISI